MASKLEINVQRLLSCAENIALKPSGKGDWRLEKVRVEGSLLTERETSRCFSTLLHFKRSCLNSKNQSKLLIVSILAKTRLSFLEAAFEIPSKITLNEFDF